MRCYFRNNCRFGNFGYLLYLMKLIDTNFAVKIECTELSQRVIDWFNKTFRLERGLDAWIIKKGFGIIFDKNIDWEPLKEDVPIGCEILTETEFMKRLELEELEGKMKEKYEGDNSAKFMPIKSEDKAILISTSILLKEYCENHNLDIKLCKAI